MIWNTFWIDYCFHLYFLTVPFNTLVLHQRHGTILMWHGRGMRPTERCLVFREKSWNDLEGYLRLLINMNSILQDCNNKPSLCLVPFPNSVCVTACDRQIFNLVMTVKITGLGSVNLSVGTHICHIFRDTVAFSALVGRQEGHPACKKYGGMVEVGTG